MTKYVDEVCLDARQRLVDKQTKQLDLRYMADKKTNHNISPEVYIVQKLHLIAYT